MRARLGVALALGVLVAGVAGVALAAPAGLSAQEGGAGQRADTVQRGDTLPPDSLLTPRELAQRRIQQRLRALSRAPGSAPPDSVRQDSLERAERARQQQGGAPSVTGTDSISTALVGLPGYRVTQYAGGAAEYDARSETLVLYGSEGAVRRREGATGEEVQAPPEPEAPAGMAVDSVPPDSLAVDSLPPDPDAGQGARGAPGRAGPGEGGGAGGGARVIAAEGSIEADSIIRYNQRTGTASARGNPLYTPAQGDAVESDSLTFDVRGGRGSAFNARTNYAQGGGTNWNVRGDLPMVAGETLYGSHTRFTSCELEEPHYHFETDELKIVKGSVMVARPVRLYFADVPVAWLPFVAQSVSQDGRDSGLLTPRFSVNDIVRTSGGYRRRVSNVGYFWAISEYMDATLALDWFDDNYTAITGSYRYSWLRQFLQGSLNVRRYWRVDGSTEFSLDTQNSWEASERTSVRLSGSFASSTDFVRRNSFDPREVTQQIRSEGGVNHRFDWGNLALSANRQQSLSDDRVNMTLPSLNLSINPVTLFPAPSGSASWYNNMTWRGSMTASQSSVDRPTDTLGFSFSQADTRDRTARLSSGLSIGQFSLDQSLDYRERAKLEVPVDSLGFFPGQLQEQGLAAFESAEGQRFRAAQEGESETTNIAETELTWSTGLSYQQKLIGTTTLTPRLSLNGRSLKIDTLAAAQDFVAAPTRMSFGATLKADLYGFWPGIGGYEAIRHKLSPSFTYDWSPEVEPSDLQAEVFRGVRASQATRALSLSLNQTWEAKAEEPDSAAADSAAAPGTAPDSAALAENPPPGAGEEPVGIDDTPPELQASDAGTAGDESGPRRLPQARIVNLLAINTSVVSYDFVRADSLGGFVDGFTSTTLTNRISSDFLRGLTINMTHDLFEDEVVAGGEGEGPGTPERTFAPHLSRLNFGFSLNPQSSIFNLFGLLGEGQPAGGQAQDTTAAEDEDDPFADDPFSQRSATDETAVIPGRGTDQDVRDRRRSARDRRGGQDWRASFQYALTRPRGDDQLTNQTLGINVDLNPTEQWEMSWRTQYNLDSGEFDDHRIRLTRDLHRWQAHFDFLKTATGNWTFRFEVSLMDNSDLKFDYEQRNLRDEGRRRR